jgi:hypothetical protein
MLVLAVVVLGLATGVPNSVLKPSGRNGVADQIAEKSLAIGIDFDEPNPDAPRPDPAEVQAQSAAAPGAWFLTQVQTPDDRIAEPSAELSEWFESHSQPLAAIVAILEKDSPEWKATGEELAQKPSLPFLAIIRLERILLAFALRSEQRGDSAAAGSALEASWSLGQSVAVRQTMIDHIIGVAIEKFQAGALRKMSDPPLQWLGRLDGNEPWQRMLDAIANEFRVPGESAFSDSSDPWVQLSRKIPQSIADALRRRSPCSVSLLTEDQLMQIVERDFSMPSSEEGREIWKVGLSIMLPNTVNAARRAARLSVDRELTLKILELRLERAASPEKRWPEGLSLDVSSVCPDATYAYRREGPTMEIRFEGTVEAPSSGPVLPLVFSSGPASTGPVPTPTPIPASPPPLTPPAPGGMIPPQ